MSRHNSSFEEGYEGGPPPRGAAAFPHDLSMEITGDNTVDYRGADDSFNRGEMGRDSLRAMGDFFQRSRSPHAAPEKKSKKSGMKMPKPNIDLRSSFRKVTNVFRRGEKDNQPLKAGSSRTSLERTEAFFSQDQPAFSPDGEGTPPGSHTPRQYDPHPGGYDLNPMTSLPTTPAPQAQPAAKSSLKNWFYPSTPATSVPTYTSYVDKAELRDPAPKHLVRMSNIIHLLLLLGMIIGVLCLAFSSEGQFYRTIGAAFLGLSAFALIGKIFFSAVYEDNPFPRVQPYFDKLQNVIGGAKDPYRHNAPASKPFNQFGGFMPPISPGREAVPMAQFKFPPQPVVQTGPPPSYFSTNGSDPYYAPSTTSSMDRPAKHDFGETLDTQMRENDSLLHKSAGMM